MQGVVHCNLNPENILMRGNGAVCVCDFSNAIDLSDPKRPAPQRAGSLDYLPPELLVLPTLQEQRQGVETFNYNLPVGTSVDIWQVS